MYIEREGGGNLRSEKWESHTDVSFLRQHALCLKMVHVHKQGTRWGSGGGGVEPGQVRYRWSCCHTQSPAPYL